MKKIAIIGIVGLPANYGGFETLAENLVKHHFVEGLKDEITIYCSSKKQLIKSPLYLSAKLRYVPLDANGVQSILYDICSMVLAIRNRNEVVLSLGVSGAIAIPFLRLFSSVKFVTNIDGMEWRRKKWSPLAKHYLRYSEKIAIKYSHEVISDNEAIADYVMEVYGIKTNVISYGGDQFSQAESKDISFLDIPSNYSYSVCRIEPDNNIHLILSAFSKMESQALVIVGNWDKNEYGKNLRKLYSNFSNLFLLDPIYDLGILKSLRSYAQTYIHGHAAGGTNPSLVEAMHFGKAVLAFDCIFNRNTTEEKALYFSDEEGIFRTFENNELIKFEKVGEELLEIAKRRYTWSLVSQQYFDLMGLVTN